MHWHWYSQPKSSCLRHARTPSQNKKKLLNQYPPHKRKHYSGGAVPVQRALPSAPKRAPQGSLCSSHHRAFVDAAARNAPAAEASMRTSSRTLSQREPPRSGPPQYARMQVPGSCTSIFTHRKTRMCMYTCTSARIHQHEKTNNAKAHLFASGMHMHPPEIRC